MTPPMKPCYAHGCTILVHQNVLMCRPHWKMVPEEIQAEVNATWRDFSRERLPENQVNYRIMHNVARNRARYAVMDFLKLNQQKRKQA